MGNLHSRAVGPVGATANHAAIVARYDHVLNNDPFAYITGFIPEAVSSETSLIPRTDLPALIQALNVALRPATEKEVHDAIAMIGGAWPHAHQKAAQAALDLFVEQLAEEMSSFPPHVLTAVIRDLRRTMTFTPSIAEIYKAAVKLAWPWRRRLLVAQAHEDEHARREAEAQAEAERRKLEQGRLARLLDTVVARCGSAAQGLTEANLADAERGMMVACVTIMTRWRDALCVGEPWAIEALPAAIVMGKAQTVMRNGKLSARRLSRALELSLTDIGEAQRLITANTPEGSEDCDRLNLPHPVTMFVEIVERLAARKRHRTAA
jgi:hypothetical protein